MKGKPVGIVMAYGDTDAFNSGAVNAIRTFQDAFSYMGARIVGMVYGSADTAGEIKANAELMEKACDLGKRVVAEAGG